MIENQTQEMFGDAGSEDNGLELSGSVGCFSEFVDGNDRRGFPAARQV